jgi:hypothetical protein
VKLPVVVLALAVSAAAQVAAPAPALPQYLTGTGYEYNRYSSPRSGALVSIGVEIKATKFYSWTTADSGIGGTAPATLRTGVAWIAAQSGRASLVLLGDTALTAVNFTLGAGVAFRVGKSDWYISPIVRAVTVDKAHAQIVPELMIWRGFKP